MNEGFQRAADFPCRLKQNQAGDIITWRMFSHWLNSTNQKKETNLSKRTIVNRCIVLIRGHLHLSLCYTIQRLHHQRFGILRDICFLRSRQPIQPDLPSVIVEAPPSGLVLQLRQASTRFGDFAVELLSILARLSESIGGVDEPYRRGLQ